MVNNSAHLQTVMTVMGSPVRLSRHIRERNIKIRKVNHTPHDSHDRRKIES